MDRIMECVPNFSEGHDKCVTDSIVEAILSVNQGGPTDEDRPSGGWVRVLNVDMGEAAARAVVTFVGEPEAVVEAAFRAVGRAAELIDMRSHHGVHPRSGATDVLPLIPVSGISLQECARMARDLAQRIWSELGIPCYCYEAAASSEQRKNLAWCRSGEYEALPQKLADPLRRPDFGPTAYNETVARSGAVNVGARNFLIAVNFNLDSTSAELAGEIAMDVREKGRPKTDGVTGEPLRDATGKKIMVPGPLKGCKAIGWYIEEYGLAQVSMNITDIEATPLHVAYEQVQRAARARGAEVTGTEIIGLVPRRCLIEAGRHFVSGADISEAEAIRTAIRVMGLDSLAEFDPDKRTI